MDDTAIRAFVDEYERTLSRFRSDSILAAMAGAAHGGSFDFPDWCEPLFDLYERLCEATDDAIDPCVGAALARLGYGPDLAFETGTSDSQRIWVAHPTWRHDVERHGTTLVTARPVHLDFGACGKGYLVDLIAAMLTQQTTVRPGYAPDFVIDAGGDILAHTSPPITVALEDPHDTSRAVGIAHIEADGRRRTGASPAQRGGWLAGHGYGRHLGGRGHAPRRNSPQRKPSRRRILPHGIGGRLGHGVVPHRPGTARPTLRFRLRHDPHRSRRHPQPAFPRHAVHRMTPQHTPTCPQPKQAHRLRKRA